MKKITLFFAACTLFANTTSQAQSMDEIADDAAQSLCTCINETYSFIDKDIQDIIVEMTNVKTEEEQTKLVLGLDKATQIRMMTQAKKMQDAEVTHEFENCVDRMGGQLEGLEEKTKDEISEEKFVRLMVLKIRNKKDCAFASFLVETGMAEEYGDFEDETANEKSKSSSKTI